MIKAIIFDFDGVIHDTLELAFNINKIIFPGITLNEYKDFFNGNIYDHKKVTPKASKKYFEMQEEEFKKLKIENEIKNELLKMKDKFTLFIISSNMEMTLNNYFENNAILHIFEKIFGAELHKSKIEKFKLLIDEYGLNKNNCIFVTDTLGDILEANKVNLNTIAVDYGFHEKERLKRGKPIKIVSSFRDILPTILKINDKRRNNKKIK
jgi:phosphoglycolate phosphatase